MNGYRERPQVRKGWGLLWVETAECLDGESSHLMWEHGKPLFFQSRDEARTFLKERYSYISKRPDLRRYPHGWRTPRVVSVALTTTLSLTAVVQ